MRDDRGSTKEAISPGQLHQQPSQGSAALVIADPATRRALETIVTSLGLEAVVLESPEKAKAKYREHEIMIADTDAARKIRVVLTETQNTGDEIKPALVAVGPDENLDDEAQRGDFDAVLKLPCPPGDIAARVSVVLYAHRALAQRYQPSLDELSLNRSIFRSVSTGISVANAQMEDMPLMYVNPSFELMSGYSLEEVEGKNCRFLQGSDRDQAGLTLVREAIAQQRQTTAVLRNYRKDGSSFWNELTLSPIFNRDGELTHFVGIQIDVTERVNMESALRESEKLAAVGRLASSISHEINNPLEAVMNLVYLTRQLIPESEATHEGLHFLKQADEELQRVKLIAAQSLRFYKQSSAPQALLCSTLVESVLELYRPRMEAQQIKIAVRERSTQHIVGLTSELRQVLSNLVANAIDAMKVSTGCTLYLRTRESTHWPDEKKGVVLTVADTGDGMSEETKRRLFQAFYTTKGSSGTGLGLWISQEIIERHHGRLRVRSSDRVGHSYTVFTLFLPYQAASGNAPSSGLSDKEVADSRGLKAVANDAPKG